MFFVTFIQDSYAITKTWIGGNDIWHDDLNWSPTGIPAFNDEVLIDGGNPGNSVVHIDSDLVRGGDTIISNGDTLNIDNGVTFHPDASVTVEVGGLISNSGTTFHTSQLFNSGTVRNFNSYDIHSLINSGAIENEISGTLEFSGSSGDSSGTITNFGIINIISYTIEIIDGTIDNRGTLDNRGTITNLGHQQHYGTINNIDGTINNEVNTPPSIINNDISSTINNLSTIINSGNIFNCGTYTGPSPLVNQLTPCTLSPDAEGQNICENLLGGTWVPNTCSVNDLVVPSGSLLTINSGATLEITNKLIISSGGGVLIKNGATLKIIS